MENNKKLSGKFMLTEVELDKFILN